MGCRGMPVAISAHILRADLTRAIQTSTDSEMIGRIHFNLALAYRAKGDHKAAQASVQEALSHGYHQARELREKLLH